jgi:hypothetical protein
MSPLLVRLADSKGTGSLRHGLLVPWASCYYSPVTFVMIFFNLIFCCLFHGVDSPPPPFSNKIVLSVEQKLKIRCYKVIHCAIRSCTDQIWCETR